MLDPDSFAWLLLPLGVILGWVLAQRLRGDGASLFTADAASSDALNTLSDQAVAAIGDAAGSDPAMAELQLTLGVTFRRRGEVDRAIAVHERLRQAAALPPALRDSAQYELAQDYLKAGLMDRAETLLDTLTGNAVHGSAALESLLSIHEQARDWPRAIEVVQRLQAVRGQDYGALLAHYHCELAEQTQTEDPATAQRWARRALEQHPNSVRASLLLGAMAEKDNNPQAALRAYRRVPEQDPRFLAEVMAPLERCANALGQPQMFAEFVEEAEQRFPQVGCLTLAHARIRQAAGKDVSAFLAQRLARHPQWPGLLAWIDAQSAAGAASLAGLGEALRQRLQSRPRYRCTRCGLTPSLLFWQCPSCKHWDSVIPDEDRL